MPNVFSTGTINQPDAGSVGLAMIEKIRDELVNHAAWELIEEFTPASSVCRWYVFKCLAAVSGLPADYYLIGCRILGSGAFYFSICEEYNSSTKTISYYPVESQYSVANFDALGRISTYSGRPCTAILGTVTGGTNSDSITPRMPGWTPSGQSTKYWIIVTDDGFTVAFNGASNGYIHCEKFTPLSVIDNPMPIFIIGNGNSYGGITRNPSIPNASGMYCWALVANFGAVLGFAGNLGLNDKLQEGQRPVAEMGITLPTQYSSWNISHWGWALGKSRRIRTGQASTTPGGFAFGDAYVIQNRLWVPYQPDHQWLWDTGVPAS